MIRVIGLSAMLVAATAQDAFPAQRSGLAPSPTTPMVVFLAGFPDDTRSFDAVAPAFEGTHAVLKLALPGYEGAPISEKWGLSFKVLIEKMHDAVEAQPHGDLYLVAHDWGAYLAVWKSKFYDAFVLNRRVDLHAIDAPPARWRGGAGSSPLDRCTRRTG